MRTHKHRHALSGLLFVAVLYCCTTVAAPIICAEGTEDPPLELRWKNLPKKDSIVTSVSTTVPMVLRNKTGQNLYVDLAAVGAFDAVRRQIALGMVMIAPYSSKTIAVNLTQFNLNISSLDYSARLVARAVARLTLDGAAQYIAYTPHVFLHASGSRILRYREQVLIDDFAAGDFAGRALKIRHWAKKRGLQLVGIGPVARSLKLTDDDGGPRAGGSSTRRAL